MTPQQALETLAHAAALAPMPKQQHILVEQAIQALKKLIEESSK
jgi:hypothetical protein